MILAILEAPTVDNYNPWQKSGSHLKRASILAAALVRNRMLPSAGPAMLEVRSWVRVDAKRQAEGQE